MFNRNKACRKFRRTPFIITLSGLFIFGSVQSTVFAANEPSEPALEVGYNILLPTYGFVETREGLHFFDPKTNSLLKDGYRNLEGHTYYFDHTGKAKTGFHEDEDKGELYYFDEDYHLVKDELIEIADKTYYAKADGACISGFYKVTSVETKTQENLAETDETETQESLAGVEEAEVQENEAKISEKQVEEAETKSHAIEESDETEGSNAVRKVIEAEEDLYYFDPIDHSMVKDEWRTIDNKDYYFDKEGKALAGLHTNPEDNETYFFNEETHAMIKDEWQIIDDNNYYFDKDGKALAGLHINPENDETYFFDEDSHVMVKNKKIEVDDTFYYFTDDGSAYQGLYLDTESNEKYYFTSPQGQVLKNDWKEVKGVDYYFGSDGAAVKGMVDVDEDGKSKYFDPESSALVTDETITHDGLVYLIDESGDVGPGTPHGYLWPSTSRDISSRFGNRFHPIYKEARFHEGIDISGEHGSNIYATSNGLVTKVSESAGLGKHVEITHTDGSKSVYGHLSAFNVDEGEEVKQGDVIAYMGNTGNSTGTHLHFEFHRPDGSLDNPLSYLQ